MTKRIPLDNPPTAKVGVLEYCYEGLNQSVLEGWAWTEAKFWCRMRNTSHEGLALLRTDYSHDQKAYLFIFNVPHYYDRIANRGIQRRLPKGYRQ